VYKGRQEVSVK